MSGNLIRRIAFAVVAIPAALTALYVGGWLLAGLLAVLGVLGTLEVYGLARRLGIEAFSGLGIAAAVAIPIAWAEQLSPEITGWTCYVCPTGDAWLFLGSAWLMAVMAAALRARRPEDRPLASIAITVLAPLYASGLLSFVMVLRHGAGAPANSWPGLWVAALPLILTWVCDTVAMAAGRLIGGPKLAPVVSPNKTWAGTIAGWVGAVLGAVAYGPLVLARFESPLAMWQLALIGAVVGTVGQVGDVVESLLKREVGVKDSSGLIPGHGGVLDRLDSLYFVVPAAALLYFSFTGP